MGDLERQALRQEWFHRGVIIGMRAGSVISERLGYKRAAEAIMEDADKHDRALSKRLTGVRDMDYHDIYLRMPMMQADDIGWPDPQPKDAEHD